MADHINTLNDVRTEMNILIQMVEADDFTAILRNSLAEFEYQGLDVLSIVREIFSRGNRTGKSRIEIQRDVTTMIILFLCRGNNVDKMLLKTNDAGRTRISALQQVYGLANNVGRGGNSVITLSRVAAVFPAATLKVLNNAGANIPRAVTLPASDFGNDFPKAMQTVIAAAIFPRTGLGVSLMKALLLYLIEENKLLSNVAGMSNADILAKVIPFARASFVSSIILENDRNRLCTDIGFIVGTQVAAGIATAVTAFTQKYPNVDLSFVN